MRGGTAARLSIWNGDSRTMAKLRIYCRVSSARRSKNGIPSIAPILDSYTAKVFGVDFGWHVSSIVNRNNEELLRKHFSISGAAGFWVVGMFEAAWTWITSPQYHASLHTCF